MRSVIPIRIAKFTNIATALCLCAFGICVLAMPDMTENAIRFTVGALMTLFGIFKLVGFFSKDLYRLAFQYDLPLGIVFIVLGVVMLAKSEQVVNSVCIMFGIAVFIDSVFKIKISVDAKKFGIRSWALLLALAVIVCALGAALLFRPTDSERVWLILFGVACIADGVLNLTEKLCTVKIVKNQRPDSIDKIEINAKENLL